MAFMEGKTISMILGTGRMGGMIGQRLAEAGFSVILSSRDAAKAQAAAAQVSESIQKPVKGASNEEAAAAGDVIFWAPNATLTNRQEVLKTLAKHLEGKVIVDVTNALSYLPKSEWGETSSTLLNLERLGVPARWTTAFKSTPAQLLKTLPDAGNPQSIWVSGDDEKAVATTIALVDAIPGFKGVKAGPLKYSKAIECCSTIAFLMTSEYGEVGLHLWG